MNLRPRRRTHRRSPDLLDQRFRLAGLDDAERYTFMQRFDLYMQRVEGERFVFERPRL